MSYQDDPEYDEVIDLVHGELAFQNELRGYGLTEEQVKEIGDLLGDEVIWQFHLKRRASPGHATPFA